MSAEHHMGKANTFKSMLDTFRHDNPANTVPDGLSEELYGGISDINREYMLEDRDKLTEFMKSIKFPDRI